MTDLVNYMKRAISVLACITLAFVVFGCSADSGKDQELNSEEVSETTSEETTVAESETETTDSEPTEETVQPPVIEMSSEGYYADYPIFSEDKTVYVRCIPGFDFYADEVNTEWDKTFYDRYIEGGMSYLDLFSGPDALNPPFAFDPYIEVAMNDSFDINWYMEREETGWDGVENDYFEISVPEVCENGITICEIRAHYTYEYDESIQTFYVLEYQINDKNYITINMFNFLPNEWIDTDPVIDSCTPENEGPTGYEDDLEVILEFYRTVEDPFLVVDKGTTVNFVE